MFRPVMRRRVGVAAALGLLPTVLLAQQAAVGPTTTLPTVTVEGSDETATGPVMGLSLIHI